MGTSPAAARTRGLQTDSNARDDSRAHNNFLLFYGAGTCPLSTNLYPLMEAEPPTAGNRKCPMTAQQGMCRVDPGGGRRLWSVRRDYWDISGLRTLHVRWWNTAEGHYLSTLGKLKS